MTLKVVNGRAEEFYEKWRPVLDHIIPLIDAGATIKEALFDFDPMAEDISSFVYFIEETGEVWHTNTNNRRDSIPPDYGVICPNGGQKYWFHRTMVVCPDGAVLSLVDDEPLPTRGLEAITNEMQRHYSALSALEEEFFLAGQWRPAYRMSLGCMVKYLECRTEDFAARVVNRDRSLARGYMMHPSDQQSPVEKALSSFRKPWQIEELNL